MPDADLQTEARRGSLEVFSELEKVVRSEEQTQTVAVELTERVEELVTEMWAVDQATCGLPYADRREPFPLRHRTDTVWVPATRFRRGVGFLPRG